MHLNNSNNKATPIPITRTTSAMVSSVFSSIERCYLSGHRLNYPYNLPAIGVQPGSIDTRSHIKGSLPVYYTHKTYL